LEHAGSELQGIVDKCVAKEPPQRYQGMKDLVVDLRRARLRLESGAVVPVAGPAKKLWFGLVASAAVLLAVVGIWLFQSEPEKRFPRRRRSLRLQ
jgi:hypothetical protein